MANPNFSPEMSTDKIYVGTNTALCLTDDIQSIKQTLADIGGIVEPVAVASMHLGRLDNNSGGEFPASNRICSDAIPIQTGKSYWQVNTKGVNMYILLYDADEMFVQYVGNIPSGQKVDITAADAVYMKLSSMIGEYDLTNTFNIYDTDPTVVTPPVGEGGLTQDQADTLYAPITHSHSDVYTKTQADAKFALKGESGSGGGGTTVDAYSKTESDARFAGITHTHVIDDITDLPTPVDAYSKTEVNTLLTGKANANHTHTEYATVSVVNGKANTNHTHDISDVSQLSTQLAGKASTSHTHSDYASSGHTHSNYLSTAGGTVNGQTYFNEIVHVDRQVRVNNQQAIFNSGTLMQFGTNNMETKINGSSIVSNKQITVASDERLKEDIKDANVKDMINFVKNINIKNFNYKDDETAKEQVGVIAQELINIDPEVAKYFVEIGDDGFYSVAVSSLVFPLIAAVQELTEKVESLKKK